MKDCFVDKKQWQNQTQMFMIFKVVFNPAGEIVTSYRKYNLWIGEDLTYNVDKLPQLRYFDTPFGRYTSHLFTNKFSV